MPSILQSHFHKFAPHTLNGYCGKTLTSGSSSALTPMCMDRKEGDLVYRLRNATSLGGITSEDIIDSKVSHLVAFDTIVFPLCMGITHLAESRDAWG